MTEKNNPRRRKLKQETESHLGCGRELPRYSIRSATAAAAAATVIRGRESRRGYRIDLGKWQSRMFLQKAPNIILFFVKNAIFHFST